MRCPIDEDISIVRVQSHMHRRGVGFAAHRVRADGAMEEIYSNEAWEEVPVQVFSSPLVVKAGEALDYRCDYKNPEPRDVAQGLTTRDEMCMLIGPYFPRTARADTPATTRRGAPPRRGSAPARPRARRRSRA
ncbi:hypothetical protein [Sorangium sp. So ce513]|uniref:monooxygenase n=1 Tax=Sorangium sp. So ce513 TaxID=3133315 RepID=UPI003F5E3B46